MTLLRTVIAAIALIFTASANAAEPEQVMWRGGGWTVSLTQSEGRSIGCHAYTDYTRGTRLVLALYRTAEWRGMLGEHAGQADLRPGPVRLFVDQRMVYEGVADQFAGGGIRLGNLPQRVVFALSQGYVVEIATPSSGSRKLSLKGSEDALAKVEQCVAFVFEAEQKARTITYRVNSSVSDGILNLREGPSSNSALVSAMPAGTSGIRALGTCRPTEDPGSSATWCQMAWGNLRGWSVMRGLTEEPASSASVAATPPAPMPSQASNAAARQATAPSKTAESSTGTAFFVSPKGHLLTNSHVVKDCRAITISQPGATGESQAVVVARDERNDLALLLAPGMNVPQPPALRRQVRLGEDVAVFGYPLSGLIASSGNFTRGSITALAGLGDDTSKLQLAAPVQPGNSGGPVLDQSGNVVGIVVGKLNALSVAKVTGNLPEQINFAIKVTTALGFLEVNQVQVSDAASLGTPMSGPDLADHAKRFTVLVSCKGE